MARNYRQKCPSCNWKNTKKDGKRKWRQSYKCRCWYVRISARRKKIAISKEELYEDFALHKQTYSELSVKYWISKRTVQKYLDEYVVEEVDIEPQNAIVLVDTTYFSDLWVMLFKNALTWKRIHYQFVPNETKSAYVLWIEHLKSEWWIIQAIVCDGKKGLLWWFWDIPTQLCQFHQLQTIRRYITKNPILEPNKELKEIASWLCRTEKSCFESELQKWYEKHKEFINEKWITEDWKGYYIHKRTRSAYFSLKRNIKYLFVYEEHMWKLDIPNTTNAIEAVFSHLKYKVNLHRWLRLDRKIKLIRYLLISRK